MPTTGIPGLTIASSGLIVWAIHFGVVYTMTAIACERGFAGNRLLGLPLIPVLVIGATIVGIGAVALIGLKAWRHLDRGLALPKEDGWPDFIPWFTASGALLGGLAILWEGMTALFVEPCP
ncbi:MAG: hypothetical protein AB7Q01_02185 [Gammaproteobacteria bacterium]